MCRLLNNMWEKRQYVHCTAVPAGQTVNNTVAYHVPVEPNSYHIVSDNIMATEPQTAAGQRPVEALAAKLRRRYALLSAASKLSTATKTSDHQASSRVSQDSTGDRASSAPGRVESAISEHYPASGDHQKRRAETNRGSAKRCRPPPPDCTYLPIDRRTNYATQNIPLGIPSAGCSITSERNTTMRPRAKRRRARTSSRSRLLCCRVNRADRLPSSRQSRRWC
jgi:hypothetical protein